MRIAIGLKHGESTKAKSFSSQKDSELSKQKERFARGGRFGADYCEHKIQSKQELNMKWTVFARSYD